MSAGASVHLRRIITGFIGLFVGGVLLSLSPWGRWLHHASPIGLSAAWTSVHKARLLDAELLRYHQFATESDGERFENLAGWTSPLQLPPESRNRLKWVPGREPVSSALSLDTVPLESPVFGVHQTLSIECWIRHYGRGLTIGGNSAGSGTLLAMGDGVWSGFCLSLHFPGNVLAFQLGRPKPLTAVGVTAIQRIPPRTWTHVAATWDGAEIELFVNGISSGRVAYTGPFFAPSRTSRFRVGYVGNGYGSIQFDVSELAVYRRCLSRTEVFSRVAPFAVSADPDVAALTQAGHLLACGRLTEAEALLREVHDQPLSAEVRDRVLLLLGQCCRERGAVADAREILEPLKRSCTIPEVQRQASLEFLALRNDYRQPDSMSRRRESVSDVADLRDATADSPAWQKAVQEFVGEVTRDESREWKRAFDERIQPILRSACHSCHTSETEFNSLDLTQFASGDEAAEASSSFWKMLGDRVVRGEMPPPTAPVPLSKAARSELLRWINSAPVQGLCEELSADDDQPRFLEEERWFTGTGVGRRLTRLELRNSLQLLLGETLAESELPAPEPAGGEGFDTAAGTVTTSSSLIEFLVDSMSALVDRRISREAETDFSESRRLLPEEFPEVRSLDAEGQMRLARKALGRFSKLAWRRPWTDREQQRLLKLYELVRADGGAFEAAVGESIKAILLSPNFLFVAEAEPSQRGSYRISSHELATRMSLFLWSSLPDEQLLQAADTGRLETPADLRRQIARMLADDKAKALGEGFGLQWLGLQRLEYLKKDTQLYPEFSAELLADFREEALQLVSYILRNNRPLHELVGADYVIVNDRLAEHYGLPFSAEKGWQKVSVDGAARGGILSLGGTLAATSFPGRTSPVLRGRWILEEILGQRIQPPPPGIPALVTVTEDGRPRSMREQLEVHRSQPGCRSCHETMDQLGFSLEKFDPLGRMRQLDRGLEIDDSARLPEGREFQGISGLRAVVLERRDEFAANLCRRLAGYAFCRSLDRFDDCIIERCLEKLKQHEWRSAVVLEEIILSYPFRHRFAPGNKGAVKADSAE